jgi:hypothetical protein
MKGIGRLLIGSVLLAGIMCPAVRAEKKETSAKTLRLPRHKRRKPDLGPKFDDMLTDIWRNAIDLNKNLFSWDTFKIFVTAFPFFIGTRMFDEKLQNCFYNGRYHKNRNQMPPWVHDMAQYSIALPIIFLGSRAFLSEDSDQRQAAQIYLTGMPFVIFTKDLIKKLDCDICYRPWHEKFSWKKRSCGGFPSGHMAEAAYSATLYGIRYGYRYAVPLGALAAFLGVTFLTSNRHYVSQLVAGACLGATYAVAANKLIDTRLQERFELTMARLSGGGPALQMTYRF